MRTWVRGFRVLLSFSFRVAPWQAALFLLCGAVMSLIGPAMSVGAKLLVDAAVAGSLRRGLIAAAALSLASGVGLINGLYYVDLLFSVVEKAGAALDKRLMELMGGIAGLAHHERPDYLDRLELLREQRGQLAWMTNATAGLLRVAIQLGLMHTFDDEGADGAQGCCAWRDNRLVGRPKAGLKGSLASSSVCGRRSHYR